MNVRVISCLDRALVPCYEQRAGVVLKARLQSCGDARVLLQAGSCSAHGARGCIPALHTQGSFAVFTTTPPSPCGRSPAGNGYVSARASPGLLPVSNGSTLGKIIPAKSPPPPPHSTQLASNSRKPDLRVITSQSGKGLMHHLVSGAARHCREFGTSAGLVQAPLPPPPAVPVGAGRISLCVSLCTEPSACPQLCTSVTGVQRVPRPRERPASAGCGGG